MTLGGNKPRELVIADEVRELLATARAQAQVNGRTEVDLDQLHGVEEAFAIRFADDLLALFAAELPLLVEHYRMRLSMVVAHTGALQGRRARGDLVGLGHDRDKDVFFCVEKSNADTTTLVTFDPETKRTISTPLLDWLRQHLAPGPGQPDAEFKPRLVREMPGTPSGRRARHSKFGEGRILNEIGEGPNRKVQVAFPNIGLKLLHARFLEFIDE